MAVYRPALPPFLGGEDKTYQVTWLDEDGDAFDLTEYTLTVEVYWSGCAQIILADGEGLEALTLAPTDDETPQFEFTLDRQQTKCIPIGKGVASILLVRELDSVIAKRGPIWLEREL